MKICARCSSMPLTELEAASGLVSWANRHAQRLECDQLADALKRCRAPESGSKLYALQTLRAVWWRLCLRVYRVSAVQRGVLQLLRHTTAVYLLKAGVDFATISQWLAHANIKTTMRYAKADMDLKRQALAQVFPETLAAPNAQPS